MLIVFVVLTLLIAYFREPLITLLRTHELPYELVESEQDFAGVLKERNAFVFVKADWSLDSVVAQREIDEFVSDWSWFNRKPKVKFYLIDITGPQSQDMVIRWAKSDPKLGFIHGGYGSAIWLQRGVALHRIDGYQCTQVDLAEQTENLFQNQDSTRF